MTENTVILSLNRYEDLKKCEDALFDSLVLEVVTYGDYDRSIMKLHSKDEQVLKIKELFEEKIKSLEQTEIYLNNEIHKLQFELSHIKWEKNNPEKSKNWIISLFKFLTSK